MYGRSDNKLLIERRSFDRPFASLPPQRPVALPLEPKRSFVAPQAQDLAFRVGIVDSEADLARVQALREEAYGHHLPGLAAQFGKPDPVDRWPDVTIFYAEDKRTRQMVGSARVQVNRSSPLQVERCVELPDHLRGRQLAEVTRMSVIGGYPHPVKIALVKAVQLYCMAMQVNGAVAAARPRLVKQYTILGFVDLFGDERLAPLSYAGDLEHRILYRATFSSDEHIRGVDHPIDHFVFRVYHPDIEIFGATASVPARLRAGPRPAGVGGYNRAA